MAKLLAAGTAVGVAAAAVRRARRGRQWADYDVENAFDTVRPTEAPSGPIEMTSAGIDRMMNVADTGMDEATAVIASAIDKSGEAAASTVGAAQDRLAPPPQSLTAGRTTPQSPATGRAVPPETTAGETIDELSPRSGPPSRNGFS